MMTIARFLSVLIAGLLFTAAVHATSATGVITVYHLNGNATGRGVCIQTQPALATTWACLYQSNRVKVPVRGFAGIELGLRIVEMKFDALTQASCHPMSFAKGVWGNFVNAR